MLAVPFVPATRPPRAPFVPVALWCAILAALLTGCGGEATRSTAPAGDFGTTPFAGAEDPMAPGALGEARALHARYRYPLAVGNHWDYVIRSRVVTIPDVGDPSTVLARTPWSAEVLGTVTAGTHEYFQVGEGDPRSAAPLVPVYLQRQDAEGFYELDPPLTPAGVRAGPGTGPLAAAIDLAAIDRSLDGSAHHAAFARAAQRVAAKLERMRRSLGDVPAATDGAEPNELTFLRYPLQLGSRWTVRESPFFGRIVAGLDELTLPVGRVRAWRIRGVSELYGPNDRVHFWYGRAGLVRIHLRAEMDAVDDTGAVIGRVVAEYDQSLVRFTTH